MFLLSVKTWLYEMFSAQEHRKYMNLNVFNVPES